MDTELKVKWLAKLRSNDYQQARGALKASNGYCCLGILCLAQERSVDGLCLTDILPTDLAGGMDDSTQRELARRNDDGNNFSEIADYIEKNL